MIQPLFYKSTIDFANEYHVNEEDVIEHLTATCLGLDTMPENTIVGMTELDLLRKLDLIDQIGGIDEAEDPRKLLYIINI